MRNCVTFSSGMEGLQGYKFCARKRGRGKRKRTKYGKGMNEEGNRDEMKSKWKKKTKNLKGKEEGGTLEMPSS